MADDRVHATTLIEQPAAAVFAVLADPAKHAAVDGTGWVGEAVDREPLTAAGQIFRMSMYHPGHPDGNYQMANRVQVFDPPRTISWEPGNEAADGTVSFPGWVWRYDLAPAGPSSTTVTLTYDWSAVPDPIREHIGFPPFGPEHLTNSLAHLADLVVG
jgi:Polyketide cyclase / dehydrase and lipid transport